MYEIGEKIVYPMHGVGIVQNIEEKDILGKTKLYYILQLHHTNMTMMVPVEISAKIGLRQVVGSDEINKALMVLQNEAQVQEEDWKARYSNNHEKLKSGSLLELAEVVRNLFQRNQIKELSNSEKRLFENALNLMVDEIAFSAELEKIEVEHSVTEILEGSCPVRLEFDEEISAYSIK